MAIVRYAPVANTLNPAAAMTIVNTSPVVKGEDYSLKVIRRLLSAGDIGVNAGQTGDNGVLDTSGCLIAQFSGAVIKDVLSLNVFRPGSGGAGNVGNLNPGTGWNRAITSTVGPQAIANVANACPVVILSWRISADGSSLYFKDSSANAAAPGAQVFAAYAAAGDFIEVLVALGNV